MSAAVAAEVAYAENRVRIKHVVNKFAQNKGGDPEELLSEAHEHFMTALRTYRDDKGTQLSTWIYFTVHHGLLESHRKEAGRASHRRQESVDFSEQPRRGFDLDGFVEDLSPDAEIVVRLALTAGRRYSQMRTARRAAAVKLLRRGWSGRRIAAAFEEVKAALR